MPLRLRLLGRRRSRQYTNIVPSGFAYARRRSRSMLPGWRDEYRWYTAFLVALLLGLCLLGIWVSTHPID